MKKQEKTQNEYDRAWNYSLFILKFRPRSTKEMMDRLARKGFSSGTSRQVLERLLSLKLLDDRQFAKGLAQARFHQGRGEYFVKRELFKKGISRDLTEEVLEETEEELPAPEERAWELLERKAKSVQGLPKQAAYRRLGGFLARRGFDLDTVKDVLNRYFNPQGD